jgi:hypothetical protein
MRKLFIICGALLCLSWTASAQDLSAALEASAATSAPTVAEPYPSFSLAPSDRDPWQVEVGYQYQHFNLLGQNFHTHGFNSDVTRYINNWYGIEGTAAVGFGNAGGVYHLDAKSLFLGGGPHISMLNGKRLEPWVHALVGWEHLRFTQSSTVGSNGALGFMAGGGVDYKFGTNLSWRIQADFLGSHFGDAIQKDYSFGSGLVLNF